MFQAVELVVPAMFDAVDSGTMLFNTLWKHTLIKRVIVLILNCIILPISNDTQSAHVLLLINFIDFRNPLKVLKIDTLLMWYFAISILRCVKKVIQTWYYFRWQFLPLPNVKKSHQTIRKYLIYYHIDLNIYKCTKYVIFINSDTFAPMFQKLNSC